MLNRGPSPLSCLPGPILAFALVDKKVFSFVISFVSVGGENIHDLASSSSFIIVIVIIIIKRKAFRDHIWFGFFLLIWDLVFGWEGDWMTITSWTTGWVACLGLLSSFVMIVERRGSFLCPFFPYTLLCLLMSFWREAQYAELLFVEGPVCRFGPVGLPISLHLSAVCSLALGRVVLVFSGMQRVMKIHIHFSTTFLKMCSTKPAKSYSRSSRGIRLGLKGLPLTS